MSWIWKHVFSPQHQCLSPSKSRLSGNKKILKPIAKVFPTVIIVCVDEPLNVHLHYPKIDYNKRSWLPQPSCFFHPSGSLPCHSSPSLAASMARLGPAALQHAAGQTCPDPMTQGCDSLPWAAPCEPNKSRHCSSSPSSALPTFLTLFTVIRLSPPCSHPRS